MSKQGKQAWMWIGIVDGKPHFYKFMEYYNGVVHADLFKSKKDASRCYEQTARVVVKFPKIEKRRNK